MTGSVVQIGAPDDEVEIAENGADGAEEPAVVAVEAVAEAEPVEAGAAEEESSSAA